MGFLSDPSGSVRRGLYKMPIVYATLIAGRKAWKKEEFPGPEARPTGFKKNLCISTVFASYVRGNPTPG
jgi:hypothetical protein